MDRPIKPQGQNPQTSKPQTSKPQTSKPRREPKWFPPAPPPKIRPKSWTDDLRALIKGRKGSKPSTILVKARPEPKWFPAPPPPKVPNPPLDIRGWVSSLSAIAGLLVFGALVTGGGILSAQFLVSPKSIVWVNNYLPEGFQLQVPGWDQPRTMAEIKTDLQKSGLKAGNKMRLGASEQDDVLIPILETASVCARDCDRIVELRVYRPINHPYKNQKGPHFRMVSQVIAEGLEDWFILSPLLDAEGEKTGGNGDKVGFTEIETLGNERNEKGMWLTLKGRKIDGDLSVAFGQLLHYNPKKAMLMPMEPWTSPAGELPQWIDVTGDKRPELVVNQTIGLEPAFKVYQLHPDGHPSGYRFKAIEMKVAGLDDRRFLDALTLARSGLWSMALASLENIKKGGGNWNTAAQVQMDYVAYHAKAMQNQADQPSNSTRQQVLVNLMDGRWEKAIESVKASPEDQSDVMDLLQFDDGTLGKRLATALNLSSNGAVRTWNTAFSYAKNGKAAALKGLGGGGDRKALSILLPDLYPKKKVAPLSTNAPLLPKDMPKDLSNPVPNPVPSTMPAPSFENQPPVEPALPSDVPMNPVPEVVPSPSPTNTSGQPSA